MLEGLVLSLAKQGLGFALAVGAGYLAYRKDREVSRLNLRILRLVLSLKEAEAQRPRRSRD